MTSLLMLSTLFLLSSGGMGYLVLPRPSLVPVYQSQPTLPADLPAHDGSSDQVLGIQSQSEQAE